MIYYFTPPDVDTTSSAMDCMSSSVGMPEMLRLPRALVSERIPFENAPYVQTLEVLRSLAD